MQEVNNNKYQNKFNNEIDLPMLLGILFQSKWIIISVTSLASIIGVIYSLLLPNIYESKATLVPVVTSKNISGALQSYSSIVGLSGINLPSRLDEGNTSQAIEKLKSLSFFENNIMENIFLPNLMAVNKWNHKNNIISYDDSTFDIESSSWTRNFSYPQQQVPSAQEAFRVFKENHLSINIDQKTNFIKLSVKHKSPYIAKEWAELVVDEVNNFYRKKDKLESEKSVSYLNKQIAMTSLSEIKQVIAMLLQEETKKLALIEANEFYVFEYIDPPVVEEHKSYPNRALICFLSAIFGVMLSIVLVFYKHYSANKTELVTI